MAQVIHPLHSSGATGAYGGTVFYRNAKKTLVRSRVSGHQPGTTSQLQHQARVRDMSAAWQALTTSQRNLWRHWATEHAVSDDWGHPRLLSGFNWYCALNLIRARFTLDPLAAPPTLVTLPPVTSFAITEGSGGNILAEWINLPTDDATIYVDLWQTAAWPPARHPSLWDATHTTYALASLGSCGLTYSDPGAHGFWVRRVSSATGQVGPWTGLYMTFAAEGVPASMILQGYIGAVLTDCRVDLDAALLVNTGEITLPDALAYSLELDAAARLQTAE